MRVVRATSPATSDFTRPVLMSSAVVPPTRGVNTSFDSPNVPWHEAHFASQISWPFATLPDPGGNPLKSGRTSMSHALISAGVAGRPTPSYISGPDKGARGQAAAGMQATSDAKSALLINLHIRHFPAV